MNIVFVLIFSQLTWFVSSESEQLFSVTTFAKLAASILLLSLSSLKIVRDNKRTVFSILAVTLAAATSAFFAQSVSAHTASIGWYLLYFGLAPMALLSSVGASRTFNNFVLAAIAITSLIVVSFGFSLVPEVVGLGVAALAVYLIDVIEVPKRDKAIRRSRELIGFPLVLQTTSLGPKDWYEVKSVKR